MDKIHGLTNYVNKMTEALSSGGIKAVVISPGSRSTPLAYAFASNENCKVYMQIDERSAGYFALGLAKATGEPVALLCTSGTAASNYYPAITEAHYARIPLVVITADRPHELREVGAPQAIDQVRMYSNHVKYSVDFPLAEDNRNLDTFIERHIQRALSVGLSAPVGPVHLNVPFREPLQIDFTMETSPTTFKKHIQSTDRLDPFGKSELRELLQEADKGLLVVGEIPIGMDKAAFWKFAKALNWPVLCDPLSNLRSEVPEDCLLLCIDNYDAMLKSESFAEQVQPDLIIRFGAQPVSKSLAMYVKKIRPTTVVLVDESPEFRDSIGVTTHHIQAAPEAVFQVIVNKPTTPYCKLWLHANEVTSSIVKKHSEGATDEGAYIQTMFQHLPNAVDLISGNSMPIRDVDTFFGKTDRDITVFTNRGANGIDGIVSTALGIQAARERPAWLLIGDLSFLHDVNGLIATRFHETDITIVIMNNDGGGIFSYLPQAKTGTYFEELFGTPTGLTFNHIAAMYDAQYASIQTMEEFKEELSKVKEKPVRIIEVFTNRAQNTEAHRKLWNEITARLDSDE